MNLEFSKKASIWVAVAVLVLIVGGYFGVYLGLNYLESSTNQVAENKEIYQAQQDRVEKLTAFKSKIDQARETISLMNEALPTEEHSASSVSIVDAIAARSGAKLVSFTRSVDSVVETNFEEMPGEESMTAGGDISYSDQPSIQREQLDISLSGNYPRVSKFINSLSSNRRPYSVNSIELSDSGANLTLVGYYLGE